MTIKFNMNVTKLKGKVNDLARIESQVAPQVYAFFKDTTPIRTGNARSHTHLINNTEILADYPYAQRLDEGYSPQAPSGMTAPTEEYAKKLILDAIKKTGNK